MWQAHPLRSIALSITAWVKLSEKEGCCICTLKSHSHPTRLPPEPKYSQGKRMTSCSWVVCLIHFVSANTPTLGLIHRQKCFIMLHLLSLLVCILQSDPFQRESDVTGNALHASKHYPVVPFQGHCKDGKLHLSSKRVTCTVSPKISKTGLASSGVFCEPCSP